MASEYQCKILVQGAREKAEEFETRVDDFVNQTRERYGPAMIGLPNVKFATDGSGGMRLLIDWVFHYPDEQKIL
jgi:hypothetical protein